MPVRTEMFAGHPFSQKFHLFIKIIHASADNKSITALRVNGNGTGLAFLFDSWSPNTQGRGCTMHKKFLESIGVNGIDFTKYPVEHLPRILHLSMIIKNTCFWISDAVVPYRLLSTEDQTKILEEYVQCIVTCQTKEV